MITPDSPVAVVLGATKKGDKVEKLGLRTVGDLLAHFPRIYLKTGELTAVDGLEPGQQLTVVGRIAKSAIATYPDRRSGRTAYRVDVLLATNGPSLRKLEIRPVKTPSTPTGMRRCCHSAVW